MSRNTLKLKKMPNIAGHLYYKSTDNDHLYIDEQKLRTKIPGDEFEIPFEDWGKFFTKISYQEQTEQDFEDDKEVAKEFAKIRAEEQVIEKKLQKHGEECPKFHHFMEYAFRSFPHKNGSGFICLKPFIRDFAVCPYCERSLQDDE